MTATAPATATGRIVWYENLSHDSKKARAFYSKLLGWGEMPTPGNNDYTMFTRDGVPLAGAFQMPAGDAMKDVPAHWLMYVGVADVDAAVKKATGLGAKAIVPPNDVPNMGRFSVLEDPQGACFALWTPAPGQPAQGEPEPAKVGEFSWHELGTDDLDKALEFYGKMFGWEKRERHDMGEMGPYQLWSRPGTPWPLGGAFNRPKEMPVNAWILYISVADINAAVARVKQLGGQVLMGPMEVPGGDTIAQCVDTNGAVFAVHKTTK